MSSDGSTMTLDKSPETLDGGKPSSHTSDNLKEFGTQSQHHQHSTSSSETKTMSQVLLARVSTTETDNPPHTGLLLETSIHLKKRSAQISDDDPPGLPPETKRIKVEDDANDTPGATSQTLSASSPSSEAADATPKKAMQEENDEESGRLAKADYVTAETLHQQESGGEACSAASDAKDTSTIATSHSSLSSSNSGVVAAGDAEKPPNTPAPPSLPLKSTKMSHLRQKYESELEYMLREFRKLERQLLGAKGNASGGEEPAGSRERREKLHSFILHLEDTIRQIDAGCQLESEGKSTVESPTGEDCQKAAENHALSKLTREKAEEENVQKLEEHILANLLPVKVRLKRQLAAQQGATRNPIGMPVSRRGMELSPAEKGKGTFAAAAEERRKQAEAAREAAEEKLIRSSAPSQFGKPLAPGVSSLTQKLHGETLGSKNRPYGHGVGSAEPPMKETENESSETKAASRKILYAGMAPGSSQHESGVSAAADVHEMLIETSSLKPKPTSPKATTATALPSRFVASRASAKPSAPASQGPSKSMKPYDDPGLSEEERRKLRKLRRKRKKDRDLRRLEKERQRQLFLQQQAAQASQMPKAQAKKCTKSNMMKGKKKGPKSVEYICALCSEVYNSTCDSNPWWALSSHECPKCRKIQIPRIDISSPANAIDYHPALLVNAEEGSPSEASMVTPGPPSSINGPPGYVISTFNSQGLPPAPRYFSPPSDSDSESDLSELSEADGFSDDSSYSDSDDDIPLTEGELAELEEFGKEYDGPKLIPDHASKLLVLMGHAQTCPGRHKSIKHRDCCNSVKYLMLHVRDCPGTTSTFDVCPFPWCRKVKHLLYHLVACPRRKDCAICSPITLSPNLRALMGLNKYRRQKQRERTKAAMVVVRTKASVGGTQKSPPPNPPPKIPKSAPPRAPVKRANRVTVTKSSTKPAKTKGLIKPTNGVVVKSLVKPVGKSVVVVKQAKPPQGSVLLSKPTVAALPEVEVEANTKDDGFVETNASKIHEVNEDVLITCVAAQTVLAVEQVIGKASMTLKAVATALATASAIEEAMNSKAALVEPKVDSDQSQNESFHSPASTTDVKQDPCQVATTTATTKSSMRTLAAPQSPLVKSPPQFPENPTVVKDETVPPL